MIGTGKSKRKLKRFTFKPYGNKWGIYSTTEFSYLLKKERIRADRANSLFSVVLFHFSTSENPNTIKTLISKFQHSVREIDYIGWHDQKTIGIILPQTSSFGAKQFLSHVKEYVVKFNYTEEIISYPVNNSLGGKSSSVESDNDKTKDLLINDFSMPIPLWKKILDKVGSIGGLLFFSPLFILLAIYIRIVSPGPVFYCQTRIGYKGREFKFWKFRTMHVNTKTDSHKKYLKTLINSNTPMAKLDERNDPRIIPGGRILRKACLDEIPQIFNILKGDMSLVGPRPCIPYEAEEYLRWHKYRFDINPGLTGLWQVSGKNKLTFKQMIRLDIKYSQNMSFLLDIRIILATIPAILWLIFESVQSHYKRAEVKIKKQKT